MFHIGSIIERFYNILFNFVKNITAITIYMYIEASTKNEVDDTRKMKVKEEFGSV